jgi:2-oxo-4-hydroxy-4-carboxy-5-ureidoimidazoline decarboxylase
MNTIDKINKLSQSEFVEIFANIFEKTKWIAEKLFSQKPFDSFEDLRLKMLRIFKTTNKEVQLKIFKAHPDLADKAIASSLTANSQTEQSNAGLDQCSQEEFDEFKLLNSKYKQKYNFPFIIAVRSKNKMEILREFKKRILNNYDDEFNEAIIQVVKIANLRLNELNIK